MSKGGEKGAGRAPSRGGTPPRRAARAAESPEKGRVGDKGSAADLEARSSELKKRLEAKEQGIGEVLAAKASGRLRLERGKDTLQDEVVAGTSKGALEPEEDDESGDGEDFQKASLVKRKKGFRELAARKPGLLLSEGLREMGKFLALREAGTDEGGANTNQTLLTPTVVRYLTTVLNQSRSGGLGLRAERELRTVGEALDQLLAGNLQGCGDILMQRFKAVEMSSDGTPWSVASKVELIPPSAVSATTRAERELAVAEAIAEARAERYLGGKGQRTSRSG